MVFDCKITAHEVISKDYRRLRFYAPEICRSAKPGQFVHVQIPNLSDRILRRPFSICDMEDDTLTVVYKIVGSGTARLADAAPGEKFQFVRDGYYCKDTKHENTFNRVVGLKDSFPAKK